MDSTGEQLHPNWRALATIHIPLKRFVKEGSQQSLQGTHCQSTNERYEIQGVDGLEIKEFYEDLIKTDGNAMLVKQKPKTVTVQDKKKLPFVVNQYHRFAMENNVAQLKELNYEGQDINVRDSYGWTALMMAACEGSTEAVKFLLELGVDRCIQDSTGKTAKDLARKKGYFNIEQILEKPLKRESSRNDVIKSEKVEPFYCEICKINFTDTSQQRHRTSTLHQFNEKSPPNINRLQKFNIPPRNKGLQLMVKQGWDKESGLGPSQSGRLYPVKTVIRKQRSGLGIEQESARVTHFQAFDKSAVQRQSSDFYKKKPRNRNDMRREKIREWKRDKRLRNELNRYKEILAVMSKSNEQKCLEILKSTEEVADQVLVNKQELVALDKRRQQNREAIRELEKPCEKSEMKVWTTIGSMLVKLDRSKALEMLKNDQQQIEREIKILQSDQKILVNKHRDLEHFSPYSGTNIKPLDRKEFNALKANLPML